MALDAITAYWKHWVLKMDKGDSLQFLSIGDGDGQGKGGNSSDDEDQSKDKAVSPPLYIIDEGILPPTLCNTDASERAKCLLSLVTGKGQSHKIFRAVVKMVNTLEVRVIIYNLHHIS